MATTTRWSTDDIPVADRFAYWRDAVCDAFLDLTPEAASTRGFQGEIVVQRRERIEIARITADPQQVARRASDDGGWCYLNLQTVGSARTTQAGTTIDTHPGDAVLLRTDRPFRFELDETFVQYSVKLPNELRSLVDLPVFVPAETGLSRAVAAMVSLANLDGSTAADDVGDWLDLALIDLTSEIIATARTATPSKQTVDAWPLISADIDRHLHCATLSPSGTARRVGMSMRSLHHAFDHRPLTYAREVRRRRMVLARSMLASPVHDGMRIRDIAADCGFGDVAHFQRIYRQQFGETPGTTRSLDRGTLTDRRASPGPGIRPR